MTADRGVSTVVDVALCLLLVSASVLVLVTAQPPSASGSPARDASTSPARETAVLLAAVTTTVAYDAGGQRRIARDTLAGLLAHAARLNARDGRSRPTFVAGVRRAVESDLDAVPGPVQVVATWRPYPTATRAGTVSVGRSPPPDATVRTVVLSVPSGRANTSAQETEFGELGARLAASLYPDGPRQQRAGSAFARDLERRFDRPAAAADATTGNRIEVAVRTWSE